MTADVELLPLHLIEAFSQALKGGRGELDAWLEVNNEADVRLHVDAYTRANVAHATAAKDAEIEALRAEVAKMRGKWADAESNLAACDSDLHVFQQRAERMAEALRNSANALERLAFAIRAPNAHTPQLVELAIAMRAAALADQPAAVGGSYPAPRNRVEAAALARLALAYLGVIDAHIDAAIARCETNSAALRGHDNRRAPEFVRCGDGTYRAFKGEGDD